MYQTISMFMSIYIDSVKQFGKLAYHTMEFLAGVNWKQIFHPPIIVYYTAKLFFVAKILCLNKIGKKIPAGHPNKEDLLNDLTYSSLLTIVESKPLLH